MPILQPLNAQPILTDPSFAAGLERGGHSIAGLRLSAFSAARWWSVCWIAWCERLRLLIVT